MKSRINARYLDDNQSHATDVVLASTCPICGVAINPRVISAVVLYDEKDEEYTKSFLLNHCANCDECFVSRHLYNDGSDIYEFDSAAPRTFYQQSFSDDIKKLSPDFVSIYNDSLHAESLGMHSICGMGYRKALEFLVKDFSITNNSNDTEKIINMTLAQCIDTYISDARLKSLAKASAWLGNDETHYAKKHPQYGTNELKAFINAFITFIDADLAYQKAQLLLSSK